MTDGLLLSVVGEELASVIFVRDYVQLEFDGPRLSMFTWPQVIMGSQTRSISDPGYRDALCALIGQTVRAVAEDPETGIALHFESGSAVLRPEPAELEGPEIAMLTGTGNTSWMVWRPGEFPFDGTKWS